MRDHLNAGTSSEIDLKQCEGGIADIEFLTQFWVLACSHEHDSLTRYTDNTRILNMAMTLGIIDNKTCDNLVGAYQTLRGQYHQLTLADDKFAQRSEQLDALLNNVKRIWQQVLGAE